MTIKFHVFLLFLITATSFFFIFFTMKLFLK